jgi:hypothetical protein
MKDVETCEKLRGAGKQALIRRCPNGETRLLCNHFNLNKIGLKSERGELKHLSNHRKRNQPRFP